MTKAIKPIFSLFLLASVVLASCSSARYKPEDLAVPVLRAVKNNSQKGLLCLLPPDKHIDNLFSANPGLFGQVYYNKQETEYRAGSLKANIVTDLEKTTYISRKNNLDWRNVHYSLAMATEEVYEGGNYRRVTVPLDFPNNPGWTLQYNAVWADDAWYLADGVYLQRPTR